MATTKKTGKGKKRLILFDAHAIIHRAYHALPEFSSSKGEPTGALYGLASMLIKIIADLKPDYMAACYDLPKPTYRHEAYAEYKAGRKQADEALIVQLKRSREIFEAFNIPMYDKEGFEADDILGTLAHTLKKEKDLEIIIASGDMDTLQLVDDKRVQVYTLKKGISDTILYDEEKVVERFGFKPELLPDYKGLRGDPSDNIIGIKGIGEKTGAELIQKFGTIEAMYATLKKNEKAFVDAGIKPRIVELLKANEEEALFSKMLAKIRCDAPIEFVLPEKPWRESISIEKANNLFTELEFRTIGNRLKEVLQKANGGGDVTSADEGAKKDVEEVRQSSLNEAGLEIINPREREELQVALWLINSNMTNPTLDDVFNFARTRSFEKAKSGIYEELRKKGLTRVFDEIEAPLVPIVKKMDTRGVLVDREYLAKLSKEYHAETAMLEKKIYELAGEEFNINSPKQLGVILFEKLGLKAKNQKKTAGGALSTRESELVKLKDAHPIIALILDHRELQKLLTTYIDSIPTALDANNRLHAHFLQAGTTTGRMSSESPNLQNIPNKSELGRKIRNAFLATPGFTLLALDYSQIELRIAAILSGDPKLIEIFREGEDVHTSVASAVFSVPAHEVTKEMRRRAKVINFGILYGMGVNSLKSALGTTREEAQTFYNDYFSKFSTLASYLDEVKVTARDTGYTETFFGRRRYFEGLKSKLPFIRAAAERMAINAPVQGTGADLTKLAMIRVDEYIEKEKLQDKVYLLLQVHDELVYEIKEDFVEKVAPKIKELMENVMTPKEAKGVPILVEPHVGKNWGEMEQLR